MFRNRSLFYGKARIAMKGNRCRSKEKSDRMMIADTYAFCKSTKAHEILACSRDKQGIWQLNRGNSRFREIESWFRNVFFIPETNTVEVYHFAGWKIHSISYIREKVSHASRVKFWKISDFLHWISNKIRENKVQVFLLSLSVSVIMINYRYHYHWIIIINDY